MLPKLPKPSKAKPAPSGPKDGKDCNEKFPPKEPPGTEPTLGESGKISGTPLIACAIAFYPGIRG